MKNESRKPYLMILCSVSTMKNLYLSQLISVSNLVLLLRPYKLTGYSTRTDEQLEDRTPFLSTQ